MPSSAAGAIQDSMNIVLGKVPAKEFDALWFVFARLSKRQIVSLSKIHQCVGVH